MPNTVISIVNNKGGVGKTTVAMNLAHALTRRDRRLLVIDMDSQCNATSLLLPRRYAEKNTLYELYSEPGIDISQNIYPTEYEKLFCLPNTDSITALEPHLLKALPGSFRILRSRIREYCLNNYDFTLIDCPPNMGFYVISALHASDFVIVPNLAGSAFSIDGLLKAIELIHEIQQDGNPDLKFLRLLINQVDRRTSMTKVTIDQIQKHFSDKEVFRTMIPVNAPFQGAENSRKSIIRYDPSSAGAKAYRSLAGEVLRILGENHG